MKSGILLIAAIALVACKPSDRNSDNRFSEEISLEGVTKLRINGVFNLYLTQSDQEYLSMEGSSELAEKLKITQEGDLLILEMEGEFNSGIFDRKDLRLDLAISTLEELDFEGVGNVETKEKFIVDEIRILGNGVGNLDLEFEARDLEVDLNMVGKASFMGTSDRIFLKNEGIGSIDASRLVAQDMEVISSGIGKVDVNCVGNLSLQVEGIGKVRYRGNPALIKKEVSGIGKVEVF